MGSELFYELQRQSYWVSIIWIAFSSEIRSELSGQKMHWKSISKLWYNPILIGYYKETNIIDLHWQIIWASMPFLIVPFRIQVLDYPRCGKFWLTSRYFDGAFKEFFFFIICFSFWCVDICLGSEDVTRRMDPKRHPKLRLFVRMTPFSISFLSKGILEMLT